MSAWTRRTIVAALCVTPLAAQTPTTPAAAAAGLTLRSIGPALMSGRIADVAVHPRDKSIWYVAAGSGGVWMTTNAGVTFAPVFDDQPSFSIGEITIDAPRVLVATDWSCRRRRRRQRRC